MKSRRVVITGVTRGLGRAAAELLIEEGHIVVGCGRTVSAVEELAGAHGPPHRFNAVDVADDRSVERWAREVLPDGPPDLLLNNAAMINENAPLWKVPPPDFSQLIDVNIKGVFHVIRHFVPAMIDAGQGIIVNFSSTWGRSTSPDVASYCASKFAIEGLTKSLAQDLPSGLAAIALNPGVIDTDMLRTCFGEGAASYPDATAWARRAVPYLLSFGPEHNGDSATVPG